MSQQNHWKETITVGKLVYRSKGRGRGKRVKYVLSYRTVTRHILSRILGREQADG